MRESAVREPRWLSRAIVEAIHEAQIREHGGSERIRNEGLVESALARSRDMWGYGNKVDLAGLAAAYAFGLVKNHGFVDGNKRAGFMAAYVFLGLNGADVEAPEPEVVIVVRDLTASRISEAEFAAWIRQHLVARPG